MVLHKYEPNCHYAFSSVVKQEEERRSSKQRSKKLDEEVATEMEAMQYERTDADSQSSDTDSRSSDTDTQPLDEATRTKRNRVLETLIELNDHGMIRFPGEEFPDDDREGESNQGEDPVPWRDVPQNNWLRILNHRDVNTENGVVKILNLLHRDGTAYKVWATSTLSKAIDETLKNREIEFENSTPPPTDLYVKSLGKKASKKNPGRSYYNFQLLHF